jgi:outer membrane receptor protein involved in Fe transport
VTSVGPANTGISPTGVAFNAPTPQNGGANSGQTSESPVTPKVGLQYMITDNDMVYVSAAKGFRAGGVNSQVSYGICQIGLDRFGYLPGDLPQEYKSDSVWSYEAGAKLRLFDGRAQVNGAVYRIDWKNPQYTTPPPQCGLVTTFNAPSARSQGFELEAQARVFGGLTLNGSFGYTDSKYTGDLVFQGRATPANNNTVTNLVLLVKGQKIPVPDYSFSVGARYDFELTPDARMYLRGDYRYTSDYATAPYPAASFTLDSFNQKIEVANFRVGVDYKDFDINVFVNNAFDRKTGNIGGGRSNCLDQQCNAYQGYNPLKTINTGYPREIGVQIAYRH